MKRSKKRFLPTDNISKIHWNRSKTLAVTAVFSFDPINSPISRKFAFYPISLGSAPQDRIRWVQVHVLACPWVPGKEKKISRPDPLSQVADPVGHSHLSWMDQQWFQKRLRMNIMSIGGQCPVLRLFCIVRLDIKVLVMKLRPGFLCLEARNVN